LDNSIDQNQINPAPDYEGDADHKDHPLWLAELGNTTFWAARVALICFDLLRVLGVFESAELYSDPLGRLEKKLLSKPLSLPEGISADEFLSSLSKSRDDRNDLLHALPNAHGLLRRKKDEPHYYREIYTISSLVVIRMQFEETARLGAHLLYADGGVAVKTWTEN
jgi:hypothetical protein